MAASGKDVPNLLKVAKHLCWLANLHQSVCACTARSAVLSSVGPLFIAHCSILCFPVTDNKKYCDHAVCLHRLDGLT